MIWVNLRHKLREILRHFTQRFCGIAKNDWTELRKLNLLTLNINIHCANIKTIINVKNLTILLRLALHQSLKVFV